MGGPNPLRFRAFLLLLALSLGLLGYGVAVAAVTSQRSTTPSVSSGATLTCPDNNRCGDNDIAVGSVCGAALCWNAPAIPAQSTDTAFHTLTAYIPGLVNIGRGISSGPDPHPPRSPLHT